MSSLHAAVRAVAAGHGVPGREVAELPGGVANQVFGLGAGLILRIPRSAEFVADLAKEAALIPVARAAGVRTPAVVERASISLDGVPTPYVLMERVHGWDHLTRPSPAIWPAVGREIALLHRVESLPEVPEDGISSGRAAEELVDGGRLDAETGRWLQGWMDELRQRFDENSPNVLLHGDLASQNLMVGDDGELAALIDWGDAAWGPRGMEFAKLRLEDVVRVLPSYKEHADRRFDGGELEAAVLWFHLQWGLSNLTGPAHNGGRHWTAAPASRVLGVLRFVASGPPGPWDGLIKKVDLWV
ncbi:aminoglycoside phosphotransferase family protein [Kribbella sp. NPDC051770]|uniref:phosphotransferase family protein n=1 Tax=Kribbella sp. NPDC051770 TaxID=3155413 RepID=UPI003448F109